MIPEAKELVERLRRNGLLMKRAEARFQHLSARELSEVEQAGHEAADLITQQDARIAELERERDEARAEIERMTPKFVAYDYLEAPSGREIAEARVAELEAALTPSADTKAAYWGEFYMGVTLRAGGEEEYRRVQIPWESIKEIMAAIRARSVLGGKNGR